MVFVNSICCPYCGSVSSKLESWAKDISKIDIEWSEFYVVNFAVVIFGISSAMIGFDNLWIALLFPGLMLINGVVAHVGVSVIKRNFSPGLITSILLFLPLSIYTYYLVYEQGFLTIRLLLTSLIGGLLIMAFPIVLQIMKKKPALKRLAFLWRL